LAKRLVFGAGVAWPEALEITGLGGKSLPVDEEIGGNL
jgi:hypothetical protein